MTQYFYLDSDNEVQGPLTLEQLHKMTKTKAISLSTQVCTQGESEWKPLYSIPTVEPAKGRESTKDSAAKEMASLVPPTPNAESQGITKGQGMIIIILMLAAIGAPFFSLLRTPERWEYRIAAPSDTLFSTSDSYGNDGWELVAARRATDGVGAANYECIFKRRKR